MCSEKHVVREEFCPVIKEPVRLKRSRAHDAIVKVICSHRSPVAPFICSRRFDEFGFFRLCVFDDQFAQAATGSPTVR